MMKNLIIPIFFILNTCVFAQKHDSLFFLVDKKADYVSFERKNTTKEDLCVKIKCDYETNCDEEYVSFGFCFYEKDLQCVSNKVKISKKDLRKKCKVIDTEWIHQQKKEIDVWKKVPVDWCFGKVNFVIFKDDLNSNQKEITAYNVSCLEGYSEFQMITLP